MWKAEGLLSEVRRLGTVRELARLEYLFHQGDPISHVFEVLGGRLRLIRRTIDDHLVALHTARDGELFAESTLFTDAYHCDGVAAVQSQVRAYPKPQFLAALRAAPGAWEAFAARQAHELQALRTYLELRSIRSARERVLQYLWIHLRAPGRTMRIEGDLQDLGAILGLTRESLYRTLAKLEAEGAIARSDEGILLKGSPFA